MEPLTPSFPNAGHAALNRREFLKWTGLGALSWLTPVSHLLARAAEQNGSREPAQSIILLWMAGGPSQLETFDPHPDTEIAGDTRAIDTALKGVQLAQGFHLLADQRPSVSLLRPLASKQA